MPYLNPSQQNPSCFGVAGGDTRIKADAAMRDLELSLAKDVNLFCGIILIPGKICMSAYLVKLMIRVLCGLGTRNFQVSMMYELRNRKNLFVHPLG